MSGDGEKVAHKQSFFLFLPKEGDWVGELARRLVGSRRLSDQTNKVPPVHTPRAASTDVNDAS
jgi:hypothetical protein